jgi:hypothetical protein
MRHAPAGQAVGRRALGASSLLALTMLAMLVAGCGGAKEPFYTPDQVRAAFEAEGISIFDRNQPIPRFSPIQEPAQSRGPEPKPVVEPLTAMLKGVRAAVLGSTTRRRTRPTTLLGFQLTVFIYPREKDARRKAADLADTLGALQILNRVNLGYKRRGNVVVSYRAYRYRYQRGVPGFPDARERIQAYDGDKPGSVAAALARLP